MGEEVGRHQCSSRSSAAKQDFFLKKIVKWVIQQCLRNYILNWRYHGPTSEHIFFTFKTKMGNSQQINENAFTSVLPLKVLHVKFQIQHRIMTTGIS